ncbi:hypothetical protein [Kingella oralis]|uniref:hypothetical protein n=1 Tax=Kingella oralis TaxID=505 RepID=UPI002D7EFC8E|nr:hypothetical protein [Kingella oralis]
MFMGVLWRVLGQPENGGMGFQAAVVVWNKGGIKPSHLGSLKTGVCCLDGFVGEPPTLHFVFRLPCLFTKSTSAAPVLFRACHDAV